MKLNQLNHKVAIFSIATLALTGAGIYAHHAIFNKPQNSDKGVFAAEGKRIDSVTATGDIQILNQGATSVQLTTNIDIAVRNSQNINASDYVELSFDNNDARILNGREIRYGDTIVATIQRVSSRHPLHPDGLQTYMVTKNRTKIESLNLSDLIGYDGVYRVVFNDKASQVSNLVLSIDATNIFNHAPYSINPIDFKHSVSVNGVKIVEKSSQTTGITNITTPRNSSFHSVNYANSIDGEQINGTIFDFAFRTKGGAEGWQIGDIVEMSLPQDSGVAFSTVRNPEEGVETSINTQELWENYGTNAANNGVLMRDGTPLKYRVLENSSHRLRYQILEIANTPSLYQFLPQLTVLDTSPKTINYEGQALNPTTATVRVERGGREIYANTRAAAGRISGAKLKSYGEIKKRGSVIVKYLDRSGNVVAPEVLLQNKTQEGTRYVAEKKNIAGYIFEKLGENSAPLEGTVREGVQNIILVYKISAQNITIKIGDTPDPKTHIPDFDKNFPGCEVKYKETPDTSKSGTIDTTLIISCPDQPDREVFVQIIVEEEPKLEPSKTQESHPEAPNTGSRQADESPNVLPAILAGISTFTLLYVIVIKRIKF